MNRRKALKTIMLLEPFLPHLSCYSVKQNQPHQLTLLVWVKVVTILFSIS
ncbi:hypothetical protein [Marinilabilia salmonicolor]|nr:hypothetical protein [Marinilabilia salmonicolor]